MHLVYYALGVCIVNGWLLYRRHCHQNGTCIQYTMHLEYALLMDGCCIEDRYMHLVYHVLGVCIVNMVAVQKTLPLVHIYYALGVCIVNGWLLYRRHCHQNGTCIQYTMHLEYALLMDGCCIEDTAMQNGTCIQYTMHLEYALLIDGCCIEDCHQNGTCIQYTMHLEYALLIDGCCIEDTAIKMVHAFSILCTWSMHC